MSLADETFYVYDRNFNLVASYLDPLHAAELLEMTVEEMITDYLDKAVLSGNKLMVKTQLVTKCIRRQPGAKNFS